MRIEREVSDQPFQPTVFFLRLPQAPRLARAQMGLFIHPGVEGRVTHPKLPTEIATGMPAFAYRIAYTICSSENFDRFIGSLLSYGTPEVVMLL
jgi:hypothetical protein